MRIGVFTLGCKVNQCESADIIAALKGLGHDAVSFFAPADVYIINTCSVTAEADKKSRQMVARALKSNPLAKVIIVGCSSQNNSKAYLNKENVIAAIGTNDKTSQILQIIESLTKQNIETDKQNKDKQNIETSRQKIETSKQNAEIDKQNTEKSRQNNEIEITHKTPLAFHSKKSEYSTHKGQIDEGDRARVHIKIQDGCNNFCSYCIVPYLRGRSRSESIPNIVARAQKFIGKTAEIVLTGINISAYRDVESTLHKASTDSMNSVSGTSGMNSTSGMDSMSCADSVNGVDSMGCVNCIDSVGSMDNKAGGLIDLVRALSVVPIRKRLGSLECGIITEEFLLAMREANFCDHFHLSLQSGSKRVLKLMNRHYSPEEYLQKVELVRRIFPLAGITTDVITGFPTETEEDHLETMEFVKRVAFSDMHVFPYSVRKGTPAAEMLQVDRTVSERRAKELIEVKNELKNAFFQRNLGTNQMVFIEDTDGEFNCGYTSNYIKVFSKAARHSFLQHKLTKIHGHNGMIGEENPLKNQ